MTENVPAYHGIFAKLSELDVYDSGSADLYGPSLADFYNRFLGDFVRDIPCFERLLADSSARVLDLACGSGRIGIALARRGFSVDGLELSKDMLALVDRNLARESAEVRSRLRFIQGDMTSFSLPQRYDLITIGVTSISLLLTAEQRSSLFRCVKEHLARGGKFIFDFLDLHGDKWKTYDNFTDVWSAEGDEGLDYAIVGQRFYPAERRFVFNMYRECVSWDGNTTRSIGTSTKAWLDTEELTEALASEGLRVCQSFGVEGTTYLVATHSAEEIRQ